MSDRQAYISLTIIICITLTFSLLGIMFGHHWDESKIVESARNSYETGNLLPGWYAYPSLPHDIATLIQASQSLSWIFPGFEEPWKRHLMIRGAFILYSSMGILFTYLLGRILTGTNGYGLIAAAFLAFSWEFGYHIRWIAPDSIMMANVVASVFFAVKYLHRTKPKNILLACCFGGLALGSKYPAGLIFVPLLLTVYFVAKNNKSGNDFIKKFFKQSCFVIGFTTLVFICTTPAFVLDFNTLIEDVLYEMNHYQSGHLGHTLQNVPFDHFYRLIEYFSLAAFASSKYLSLLVFLFVLPGVVHLSKLERKVNWVWLVFPIVYIVFFSFQKVFLVRNYQVILPFLFILATLGFKQILERKVKSMKPFKIASIILVALTLGYNICFAYNAGFSILNYSKDQLIPELAAYIKKHPGNTYFLTEPIRKDFKRQRKEIPANVISADSLPKKGTYKVATYNPPKAYRHLWEAYHHNYVNKVIGSLEVNFNYYPNWAGYPKILILPREHYDAILSKKEDADPNP